jgi:opine dehydrogenase
VLWVSGSIEESPLGFMTNMFSYPTCIFPFFRLWQRYDGKWGSDSDVPYFYRDFDEQSAANLRKLDADYSAIRTAIRKHFPDRPFTYMISYLELENLNHNSGHAEILKSLRDSKQLAGIKTPTEIGPHGAHHLNVHCRFFTDDIPYGLLVAKWVAEKLNVETPFINEVILWAQLLRGELFLNSDGTINKEFCLQEKYTSGIPESYGITSVDAILD